ncbi:hypothetical protein OG206_32470 [Streptomyces sp. NBC_01341]|uniref:hypothetical protein n=1 Tax=Streptomyces sp. NBC_01341 TaxID=2903831 RepID=UPI002E0F355A|nr:hypothetical protein OG206_32470 [Streptomyces sp. NBC_01341]
MLKKICRFVQVAPALVKDAYRGAVLKALVLAPAWTMAYLWVVEKTDDYYSHDLALALGLTVGLMLLAPAWVGIVGLLPIAWATRDKKQNK